MKKQTSIAGHVFDADLSKVEFVFDSKQLTEDEHIENGEILISENDHDNIQFFLRVNNIKYGQNPNWSKEVARGFNFNLRQDDIHKEHESPGEIYGVQRDEQLYHIAECEILGVTNKDNVFLSARRLPSYFSKVRKISDEDLNTSLKDFVGDLQFANIRSGSKSLGIQGGIFKEILSKHIGVFAKTGGGKSNTIKTLVGSIMDTKGEAGTLVLEPHGEYLNELKKHPLSPEFLIVYNQDGRGNDHKVRISYSRISVESVLSMRNQMKWSEPQERLLFEVSSKFGIRWFEKFIKTPIDIAEYSAKKNTDDDVFDFNFDEDGQLTTLQALFPNTNVETMRATQSKLKRIANSTFLTPEDNLDDLNNIYNYLNKGKTVLIDMAKLSKLEELFLSSILSGEILKRRKYEYIKDSDVFEKESVPIVIVLEEAQRVLGRNEDTDSNVFPQIVNEGRKFKVGLIAITQQPKIVDPVILSQFNTLIILGISDENDFEVLKGSSQNPLQQLKLEIKQLMPGEAIVCSPKLPFAMPLKIKLYKDYISNHNASKINISPSRNSFDGFN